MLAQEKLAVGLEETAGELEARLAPLGARLATQVIERLATGTVTGVKQDRSLVTKAPKLTKEQGLIDWTRPAQEVCNQVRAMQPWPTAYTWWHRGAKPALRVIVNRTGRIAACLSGPGHAAPGSILQIGDSDSLWTATGGNEVLEVCELQPAGKRRMAAGEFLRGNAVSPGDW